MSSEIPKSSGTVISRPREKIRVVRTIWNRFQAVESPSMPSRAVRWWGWNTVSTIRKQA